MLWSQDGLDNGLTKVWTWYTMVTRKSDQRPKFGNRMENGCTKVVIDHQKDHRTKSEPSLENKCTKIWPRVTKKSDQRLKSGHCLDNGCTKLWAGVARYYLIQIYDEY